MNGYLFVVIIFRCLVCSTSNHEHDTIGQIDKEIETFSSTSKTQEMICNLEEVTAHQEKPSTHFKFAGQASARADSHDRHTVDTRNQATEQKTQEMVQHKIKHNSYHSKLHKKEEMLGLDTQRINDAEFKLQSLISPEFHQGRVAMRSGKPFGSMEMNTLTPEQIAFVQSTSQWPKFYQPQPSNSPTKTIYPEDPVLFPNEKIGGNNHNDNNWVTNSPKQGMTPFGDDMWGAMPHSNRGSSFSLNSDLNGMFGGMQKGHSNSMIFEEKPSYLANGDSPVGATKSILGDFGEGKSSSIGGGTIDQLNDELNSITNPKGMFRKENSMLDVDTSKILNEDLGMSSSSILGPSKNSFASLFDEGLQGGRGIGRPVGILGNILKASKSMPTGKVNKPSPRSRNWFNDGPFSRREHLEKVKGFKGSRPNTQEEHSTRQADSRLDATRKVTPHHAPGKKVKQQKDRKFEASYRNFVEHKMKRRHYQVE